uniref:hypothetical protein n=2 Tax=Yoonia sp. TaxID=2212373 RepID=UPI004047BF1E
ATNRPQPHAIDQTQLKNQWAAAAAYSNVGRGFRSHPHNLLPIAMLNKCRSRWFSENLAFNNFLATVR